MKGPKYNNLLALFLTVLLNITGFSVAQLKAQTDFPVVNATLTLIPPYSPYYSDYSGINAGKVLLVLQNTGAISQQVKLLATLTGDNGITISTKADYVPLNPITLNPYETKQLNGLALKDIFDLNSLDIKGIDKNKLITSSRLPEGNYTLCVRVSNGRPGTAIGSGTMITGPGCASLTISYPDAPILINPLNAISIAATTPQSVIFNWVNTTTVPMGTQYQFQLAEMPALVKADPNQILNASSFPLINRTLTSTSYVLSPSDPPLKPNTTYAWRIKAIDPLGNIIFKNDGFSAAGIFTYGKIEEAPQLISPANDMILKAADNASLAFLWSKTNYINPINYTLQVVEVPASATNTAVLFSKNSFLFNKTLNQNQYLQTSKDFTLVDGKKYAWRVKATINDNSLSFDNDGWSSIYTFSYTSAIQNTEGLAKAPQISSPKTGSTYQQLANNMQPLISIGWDAVKGLSYPLNYEVKIISIPKGITLNEAVSANMVIFSKKTNGTSLNFNPNTDLTKSDITAGGLIAGSAYAVLVTAFPADTGWYYAEQKKLLAEGKPALSRIENNGQSLPVSFTYTEEEKTIVNTPVSSSVTGRLYYRYKDVGEKPKETNLAFPQVTTKAITGIAGTIYQDSYDNDKFPDVAAINRFPMVSPTGNKQYPLKNVMLNLVYVIYKSNSKNPTKFTEITLLDQLDYNNEQLPLNGLKIPYNTLISTTKAKVDGSYAFTFPADKKFGYIGSQNGYSYFGAAKLIVGENWYYISSNPNLMSAETSYYTSPDLIVFPKSGKTTTVADDIVFVKSYNVEVTVSASKNIEKQSITAGNGIPNYEVQITETQVPVQIKAGVNDILSIPTNFTSFKDNPETIPVEANADSYAQSNNGITDIAKTNANGMATFKNLLLAHTHKAVAVNNPFDGTVTYKTTSSDAIGNKQQVDMTGLIAPFNSDFEVSTGKVSLPVEPQKPEIYLRAVTIQNGIPQGIPSVQVQMISIDLKTNLAKVDNGITNENGYFKLTDINENAKWYIILSKTGFKNKEIAAGQQILPGERFPATVEQEMEGAGKLSGYIVNEKNEPVSCNIRVGSGPYIKNDKTGYFNISNVPTGMQSIELVPTVDNYFAEKLNLVNIKADGSISKISNILNNTDGKIVLKEKLHRVQFKVIDEDGKPIDKAKITIGNMSRLLYLTQSTGLTNEIALANTDDEFKISVTANGYVKYDDYKIIPLSKTATLINIVLKTGQTITGTVVDAKTKKPVANARVYTITGTNADGEVQTETYTDANGNYTLNNVESNVGFISVTSGGGSVQALSAPRMSTTISIQGNLPVKVYAVKSGNEAYILQEQMSKGTSAIGKSTANFELTTLNAKAEIWGIPIEVSSINTTAQATSLKGSFVKIPGNNTFKPADSTLKLPFNALAVRLIQGTTGTTIEPLNEKVPLELTAYKVIAFNDYNFEVLGTDAANSLQKLNIEKNGGNGVLKGYITSKLSFNFSYQYSGMFLLNIPVGTRLPNGQLITIATTLLPVLYANRGSQPVTSYNLMALYGKSDFQIHNFPAQLTSGTFDKTAFYLDASVNLQIPLVGINTIQAGQIKISRNNIEWNQYTGEINIPLEKWTIKGKGLAYDINQGGFKVINGVLATDLPQVTLNNIMLMPKAIDLGSINLNGNEALTLGGVVPLNIRPNAKLTLSYDDAAPFDQKPHYRLNLSGIENTVVAYAGNLPGLSGQTIDVRIFSAYSDAKHTTLILDEKKLNYYNVVSQTLSGIEVGNNFFTLIGNSDINIPGANNNITSRFKFAKDNGTVNLSVDKLPIEIEAAGKVRFEADKFTLSLNNLTAEGKVLIYKNSLADAIPGLRGRLNKTTTATQNTIIMNFLDNQEIIMGDKSLSIVSGGTKVVNNIWNNLKFTGRPKNYIIAGKNLLEKGNDEIDFEIKGGIETDKNSNKAIKLSDISTPFGDLSLAFDFENKIFQGALAFSGQNFPLGPVIVHAGTVDLQMDSKGFVLVGAITNAEVSALPAAIFGGFQSGIALGYYNGALPGYMKNKLLNVTLYNELPSTFNTGLKGFYVNVMKTLGKDDFPHLPGPSLNSIPIVGVFVPVFDFSAGIDLYAYLNGTEISIGGKAFAQASCYYDLQLCTIGLSGGTNGNFNMKFNSSEGLTGNLLFGINGRINYCVGSLGIGLDLNMTKDKDKFTFKPSLR
ncbi:hypothetical protein [Pseudopedobacter beijingensis]|uniref:Uncharacterized protein n=1 Tax=Pseudopedobacter beijingensis TaxID=1207056 RepID=A0ABW4IJA0_9SPHI